MGFRYGLNKLDLETKLQLGSLLDQVRTLSDFKQLIKPNQELVGIRSKELKIEFNCSWSN